MDTTLIITSLVPAIMLFLIGVIVRFFPPTRANNALIVKAPEWWSHDQDTWDRAHSMLAKWYLVYSLVLAAFCGLLLFLEVGYGSTLGYILLAVLFLLANIQVRRSMESTKK